MMFSAQQSSATQTQPIAMAKAEMTMEVAMKRGTKVATI